MYKRPTFKDQVSEVCSKVFAKLRSLWQHRQVFSRKNRGMMVKSLVIAAQFCVLWLGLFDKFVSLDARSLEGVFSACLCFVYGLRRYDSTREKVDDVFQASALLVLSRKPKFFFYRLVGRRSTPCPELLPRVEIIFFLTEIQFALIGLACRRCDWKKFVFFSSRSSYDERCTRFIAGVVFGSTTW